MLNVIGESIGYRDGKYTRTYYFLGGTEEIVIIPESLYLRLKRRGVREHNYQKESSELSRIFGSTLEQVIYIE